MKFRHTSWGIKRLIDLYNGDKLLLNPPYQRNPVWSADAQRELIGTILRGWPMPNFFMLHRPDGVWEMVDGQQRARTIFGFYRGVLSGPDDRYFGDLFAAKSDQGFLDYQISVTVLSDIQQGEAIEKFYALVNSTGLRLNAPEVRKAAFYDTRLLRLVTDLAAQPDFKHLGLFTDISARRMNDIEFVVELVGQLRYGTMDKKDRLEDMFKSDVSKEECEMLRSEFNRIIKIFVAFNKQSPFSKSRYRQKNDFYSLFGFLHARPALGKEVLAQSYRILLKIGPYIRPYQEGSEALAEYAMNCVTQSNSKKARDARHRFLDDLLLNTSNKPNKVQEDVMRFFGAKKSFLKKVGGFLMIDAVRLSDPDGAELTLR